jgi:hypothetical protein
VSFGMMGQTQALTGIHREGIEGGKDAPGRRAEEREEGIGREGVEKGEREGKGREGKEQRAYSKVNHVSKLFRYTREQNNNSA